jgi:hypothetical protein
MEKQLKLSELLGKITEEGKEISFHEFLKHKVGGTSEIHKGYIGEMLDAALDPDVEWSEVDDLIGPITCELVGEAFQEDRKVYVSWSKA